MMDYGAFKVLEKIFESNNSIVYRGIRASDSCPVIAKVLANPNPDNADIARFKNEYEVLQKFDHKSIVKALSFERHQNNYIILFEDIGAKSLRALFRESIMEISQFLDLAIQLSFSLGYLHGQSIIHKDVNPSNIIWNAETNHVQLIDFSICSELQRENSGDPSFGSMDGTLAYVSPEQTGRINRSVDFRSDFYSLGVTFYELLTGRIPFSDEDVGECIHCHIAKPIPDPRRHNRSIPDGLVALIQKLTAKDAEDRYQSAKGLIYDLEYCKRMWLEREDIPAFSLAREDVRTHFAVPEKLYGREEEVKLILGIFDEAVKQGSQFLTVSGFSGIGKSALIHEVSKPIARKNGFYITGKFDQFSRNVPFSAFIQALQSLIRQLKNLPPTTLLRYSSALKQTLGANAQIITEMAADFVDIVGPLPPLPPLEPEQARNRSMLTIMDLIKVICSEEHPLAIFLDDMQWADQGSINALEYLITGSRVKGLFIITAFRHNELHAGHAFQLSLEYIQKNRPFHDFHLKPLSEDSVRQMVADTLHVSVPEVEELARHVYRKTAGNPFFIAEFLNEMKDRHLISFDSLGGTWRWDLKAISELEVPDNVGDMLIDKLKQLPDAVRETLQIAACVGSQFTWKALRLIQPSDLEALSASLWIALQREIITPLDENYRLLKSLRDEHHTATSADFDTVFKFRHDRLQEACSEQIDKEQKQRTHLLIARFRLEAAEKSAERDAVLESEAIEIVRHYNEALDIISDRREQLLVSALNLKAAHRARNAVAHKPAYEMAKAGLYFLREEDWNEHYQLSFDLNQEYMQCAYLSGLYDEAERISQVLMDHARTHLERVRILLMQAAQCSAISKKVECISKCLEGLKLLGIRIPSKPGYGSILLEIIRAKFLLGKRSIPTLEHRPTVTDPEKNLIMRFFNILTPAAFQTGALELFALGTLKSTNITLRYGNFSETSYTLVAYSMLLIHILGQKTKGHMFANLAVKLLEHGDPIEYNKGVVLSLYASLVSHWYYKPSVVQSHFKAAIASCHEAGETFWMGVAADLIVPSRLHDGEDLDSFLAEAKKGLDITHKSKMPDVIHYNNLVIAYLSCLKGQTDGPSSFSTEYETEEDMIQGMRDTKFGTGVQTYHTLKGMIAFHNGNIEEADRHSWQAICLLKPVLGLVSSHLAHSYRFFVKAAIAGRQRGWRRLYSYIPLYLHYLFIKLWADAVPSNFQHTASLMRAELSRVRRNSFTATLSLYDKAIADAQSINDFSTAMACEMAGEFCLDNNLKEAGRGYLTKAVLAYERFGAHPKALDLSKRHDLANLLALSATTRTSRHQTAQKKTVTGTMTTLDHVTALRTAQSLASEIKIEELFKKIMEELIQNAGAEKGFLIMQNSRDRSWEIRVACQHGEAVNFLSEPVLGSQRVPAQIIQSVIASNEAVILDDASQRGEFADLPYIQQNRIRSVLAIPLTHKGRILGVVHMENNLASGVFTEARAEFVRLLSAHAAVALENSQLYKELEDKVAENTMDIQSMLTHLRQGILTIVENGVIHHKYSNHLTQIMQTTDISGRDAVAFIFSHSDIQSDQLAQMKNVIHAVGEHRLTYELNDHVLVTEYTRTMPDGSSKILNLDWAAIISKDDRVEKILVTIRDITEIRRMQIQANHQEQELQVTDELLKLTPEMWVGFYTLAHRTLMDIEDLTRMTPNFQLEQINNVFIKYHTLKGHARSLRLQLLLPALNDSEETLTQCRVKKYWDGSYVLADTKRCLQTLELYQEVFTNKLSSYSQPMASGGSSWDAVKERILQHFPAESERLEVYTAVASARTMDDILSPLCSSLPEIARELLKEPPNVAVEGEPILFHEAGAQVLSDILIHLVRNSLDHGIEVPDIRVQHNKPATGRMRLAVKREPHRIVFEWSDDGAGLDLTALRSKAVEASLISTTDRLNAGSLAEFIFHSGLSTRNSVTNISGRGVGMDAVRRILRDHGGDIEIMVAPDARPEGRCRFSLKFFLPSTVALTLADAPLTIRAAS